MGNFDPHYYPEFLCPVCGDRYTDAPDRPCSNCRDQDVIDREPWLDDPNDPINWPAPPGHLNDEEQRKWLDDYAAGMIADQPFVEPKWKDVVLQDDDDDFELLDDDEPDEDDGSTDWLRDV